MGLAALACLVLAAGMAGCGGGGDDSTATTTTTATTGQAKPPATKTPKATGEGQGQGQAEGSTTQQSEPQESTFTPKPHHDSGGGSEQFRVKGGDNSVQEFGDEADSSELEEAASALHGFLDARAEGAWATACSHLSAGVVTSLQRVGAASKGLKSASCAKLLAGLSAGVPASVLAEAAVANVGSLRSEGDSAFLIYRGPEEAVYGISMQEEDGEWKVGALSGVPLG